MKDSIPMEVREERLQRLNEVVNKYFLENNQKLLGKELLVLVEGISTKKNMYYGYSDTNKLVNFESDKKLTLGDIVSVKIEEVHTWSIDGRVK